MIKARISSLVSLFPLPQYVIVLEDEEKAHLIPIWIGVNEGNAIALEMNGEKFPRPLTHDLMVNIFSTIGAKIDKIIITDIKENSYFAEIVISIGKKSYKIDSRPSDSLALAVRAKCPIFIAKTVLEKCPTIEKPISEEEVTSFKDELKHLTAEEFFKRLEAAPSKKKDINPNIGALDIETEEGEPFEEYDEGDSDDDLDDDDDDFDEEMDYEGGSPKPSLD